uniref:MICOS complex subunit MIC60 n=1 Tax=Bombyx mori TaxID=7091 RepID=A0A8R2RA91_BOMMO|nr:uncharacterized protein LOC105841628 isoform X3 [Bombyx mori]
MIRIAQHGVNIRTILQRRHRPLQLQGSHLHQCTSLYKYIDPRERPPCPPPPVPPPPAPRDYKLFWGAMTALVLAGGFAAYAKTSPEVRDWLTINAPWFDDVIAVAYQENMTYKEFILQCTEDAKKYLNSYVRDDKPKQCSFEEGSALSNVELPDQPADQALREKENESPCDTLPPPVVTKDVCEIEKCLTDLADTALNNYGTARDACAYYNKLVEETMLDFSMSSLGELRHAMLERQDLVKTSVDNANYAVSRLDELTRYFECGVQAPKESLDNTKALLKDYRDKIQTTSANYQWENDRSLAMDKQWQMVGEVVEKYSAETQQMFPAPRRGQTDTDLLLIHATRYMQQLEGEVREARAAMSARVARGLLTLPQDEQQRSGREALVQAAVRRRRTEMDREYRKRSEELRAANEHMISECLKRQRAEHEETLRQRVLQKEIEAKARLNKLIAEKVAAEKLVLAAQLAEMRSKLNVVEEKLNDGEGGLKSGASGRRRGPAVRVLPVVAAVHVTIRQDIRDPAGGVRELHRCAARRFGHIRFTAEGAVLAGARVVRARGALRARGAGRGGGGGGAVGAARGGAAGRAGRRARRPRARRAPRPAVRVTRGRGARGAGRAGAGRAGGGARGGRGARGEDSANLPFLVATLN